MNKKYFVADVTSGEWIVVEELVYPVDAVLRTPVEGHLMVMIEGNLDVEVDISGEVLLLIPSGHVTAVFDGVLVSPGSPIKIRAPDATADNPTRVVLNFW